MWQDLKTIVSSITSVMVGVCRTTEKTVELVENEVDNLAEEQKLRFDEIAKERLALEAPEQS